MPARPGACGQHHDIGGGDRTVLERDALRAAALHEDLLHRPLLVDGDAGGLGRHTQRLHQLAVVDLMVLRREQGAGDLAGEMRLPRPCRRRRQPFERQVELPLKLQAVGDLGLIVRGEGEDQRALATQFDVDGCRAQKLRGEAGPARLALAAERDQRLFAGLRLAAGGEHSGGGVACAGSRLAALENGDRGAAGEPPRDAESDDPRADDGNARASRGAGIRPGQRGSLRWHDPDRFDGCDLSRPVLDPARSGEKEGRHPWPMPQ